LIDRDLAPLIVVQYVALAQITVHCSLVHF